MLKSRYFWKLFGAMAVAVIAVALLVLSILPGAFETLARNRAVAELESVTGMAAAIFTSAPQSPQEHAADLARSSGHRITILAENGLVLGESMRSPVGMESHQLRPEVVRALANGSGTDRRVSATTGIDTLYFARRINAPDGSGPQVIRAATAWADIDQGVSDARLRVWLAVLLGVGVALGLSALLARRLVVPVERLTQLAISQSNSSSGETQRREASRDELGRLSRAVVAMRNRLTRRAASAEHQQEQVIRVLGSLRDGVIAVDPDIRITHINRSAEALFRLPRSASVGRVIHEVIRVPGVLEAAEAACSGADISTTDVYLHQAGVERVVEIQASALQDAAGESSGGVIVLRDVTELRGLETMRQDFVANVSHELKTPLTAIRSLTETLLDDPEAPPEIQRRFLEKIDAQSDRLLALVTDLLSLSRLESPPTEVRREIVDLTSCATEVVRLLTPPATIKEIALNFEIPPDAVLVQAESEGIRQMISNLLDNAIKYSPQRGKVWLTVRTDGDSAVIEVRDTGIGIEASQVDRIFERFYRVDKARSREVGGTGLGLAIVKHVVASAGGEIDVKSVPGRGSTFTVRLPLATEPATQSESD